MKTLKTSRYLSGPVAALLLTAGTLAPPTPAFSQPTGLPPYIEVTGTAWQEVAPDEIFISFTITEKIPAADLTVGQAGASPQEKITIEKQEEKLKKELKNLGVDLKNLTPAPERIGAMSSVGLPEGRQASFPKNYVLKVSSPSISEKVFTQLEKLEIRGAYISNQSYSKIEEVKKETRIQAMKSAKEKAEYLLAAIGEQMGKAILVQEKEREYKGEQHTPATAGGASSMPASAFALPMTPGGMGSSEIKNIKVQEEVMVRFEIK